MVIIFWISGYRLKIIDKPKLIENINNGKPKVTPYIIGRVFFRPKLNAEYEAIKLLGPGEKAAAEQNNIKAIKSENIIMVYAIFKPFIVGCDGCNKSTFPSSSIAPRTKNWDLIPAIFFSGKLQTPTTCFPFKLSSL